MTTSERNAAESNKAVEAKDRHDEIVYLLKEISSLLKGQAECIVQMADDISVIKSVLYEGHFSVIDTSDEESEHFDPEVTLGFIESQILDEMERLRKMWELEGVEFTPSELRERAVANLLDDIPF